MISRRITEHSELQNMFDKLNISHASMTTHKEINKDGKLGVDQIFLRLVFNRKFIDFVFDHNEEFSYYQIGTMKKEKSE